VTASRGAVFLSYSSEDADVASGSARVFATQALRYGSIKAHCAAAMPGMLRFGNRSDPAPCAYLSSRQARVLARKGIFASSGSLRLTAPT
jgi:hypothetical protein